MGLAAAALAALAACASPPKEGQPAAPRVLGPAAIAPLRPGETGLAIACAKVFALDDADQVFSPGMVVVRGGRVEAVGERFDLPEGFVRLEFPAGWACPGMIDLHSHVHAGGWGDLNDMVLPINAEFRSSPAIRPGNPLVERACAGGVTTLFGIPGSGTSLAGFGVLYKTKGDLTRYEDAVLADPGGMKVAQAYNPERGAGDMGLTRAGLGWLLEQANDSARAALAQDRFDPRLENLKKVHAKELPVLIHTAGSDGVGNTVRMWRHTYDVRSVLSHGCFDGWKVARFAGESGMPVNNGPRTIDYFTSREGAVIGFTRKYVDEGAPLVSLNTDAPVMPQEELFLQGAMASRYGAEPYGMLRGLTIHPAKSFGIEGRVGSLEPGKDADLAVFDGDPLDPRSRVEMVLIDGRIEYDRARDGQRF